MPTKSFAWGTITLGFLLSLSMQDPHRAFADPGPAAALPAAVVPAAAPAPAPRRKQPFEDEIAAFEEADRKSPPPAGAVIFTGSSIITRWDSLAKDFPEITVMNRGFGGSLMENNVQYVDRLIIPCKPKMVVICAGTNDIDNRHTPENVLRDFQRYVAKIHAALPDTRVVYISINPSIARIKQKDQVIRTNTLIDEYIREDNGQTAPMTYIDTYSFMLGADGNPRPDIYIADRHHFNAVGYAEFTQLLHPQILALLGVQATPVQSQLK